MIGTIINAAAVTAGSILGTLVGNRMPAKYVNIAFQGIGLITLGIGVTMTMQTVNMILGVVSIVTGAIVGQMLGIDVGLEKLGGHLKGVCGSNSKNFTEGFVTASLLFCVGSMAILGSFEDGLGQPPKLLLTKSLMDGIAAFALASSFGIGVLFSVAVIVIYQGLLTLFASHVMSFFSQVVIDDMTGVGGIMLLGVGISVLKIKDISVTNMLPALLFIVILSYCFG